MAVPAVMFAAASGVAIARGVDQSPASPTGAGQASAAPKAAPAATSTTAAEAAVGIPVRSERVQRSCGACHAPDAQQRMSRISYRRATPEGWEQTIKRMVSLNGVSLDPAQAREILKYLADNHGLAPEEAAPAAFEAERRLIDHKYTADRDTEDLCTRCHSMGRVIAERRTKEEWSLLLATHRGYYPLIDMQGFRRMSTRRPEPGPDGRPPDMRQPMDKAIDHLSRALPLTTAEWAAWTATRRPPRLAGRWAVSGYEPGKGPIFGEMTITAAGPGDAFTTTTRYRYARSGQEVTRTGRSVVYTGFQWRGRSTESGSGGAPGRGTASSGGSNGSSTNGAASGQGAGPAAQGGLREVMRVDRTWREMTGRWFTGAYNERGIDITLRRLDGLSIFSGPIVLGTSRTALEAGGTRPLDIYGANLPAKLAAADIDLGPGVQVAQVVSARPDLVSLQVKIAADAAPGPRDVFLAGAAKPAAFIVFDHIDALKVTPAAGMARIGGAVMPRQYQQFEAIALHRGADDKPGTPDDLELGPVDVAWSLEEYAATLGDDDLKFVGTIDQAGLFTPNVDGPNPQRSGNRNNIGDVWVVATLPAKGADGQSKPIRARAHLLVSVPLYLNWDRSLGGSQ